MTDKGILVLQDYTDSQEDVLGSCIETYPTTSYDPNQTINIKVEEFSDVEEEEDPVPIQFPGIEAEHVSCFFFSPTNSRASAAACFVY
jgi:hypothetical protein